MTPGFQSGSLYVYATAEKIIAFDPDHPKDPYVFEVVDGQPTGEGHIFIRHEPTNRVIRERSARYEGSVADFFDFILQIMERLATPFQQQVVTEVYHFWMQNANDDYLKRALEAVSTGCYETDVQLLWEFQTIEKIMTPLYQRRELKLKGWRQTIKATISELDLPNQINSELDLPNRRHLDAATIARSLEGRIKRNPVTLRTASLNLIEIIHPRLSGASVAVQVGRARKAISTRTPRLPFSIKIG